MKKNTQNKTTTATTEAPASQERKPDLSGRSEAKPDFYARLLADTPTDKAAGILAALCRRKDYAIRRIMADHEAGIGFDDAIKALAEVYKPRPATTTANG